MTLEEAKTKIEDILEEATETEYAVSYVTSCDAEALRMAIEALQKQINFPTQMSGTSDTINYDFLQPESEYVFYDDDHGFCINTQDVIDCIKRAPHILPTDAKCMPSAHPDVIRRTDVIELIKDSYYNLAESMDDTWAMIEDVEKIPSAQPTLYGYNVEHLILIASVLQKENLPPERITEVLTDIGRVVAIVRDEFADNLRKAVENAGFDKQTGGD